MAQKDYESRRGFILFKKKSGVQWYISLTVLITSDMLALKSLKQSAVDHSVSLC